MPGYITFHPKELEKPYSLRSKSKIFLCSTIELFHPAISEKWRNMIFRVIEDLPQHTFQILTKFPQNIGRKMPDNVWLGTTVTKKDDLFRLTHLCRVQAKRRFVSLEPLLEYTQWGGYRMEFSSLDWIIVGKLTGYGKKYEPFPYCINQFRFYARRYGIPLFEKNNLKSIMERNLIQEFPHEKNISSNL